MSAPNSSYRPDIDGLRALAVLPVVLYHAGFSTFSGGYVGVDVFFVISGFLITSIILPEIGNGDFRLANFYERRIRRLFPALFVLLFVCAVPAFWLLMPEELEDFGQSVATTALFSSNILFWSEEGYFEGPAELKPLLHTWSLAIEEQYYLLFPALLLLIRRLVRQRFDYWVLNLTLVLFFGSLALSIWSVNNHPSAGFFLLPSRTWELMLGSLLAMLPTALPLARWLRESLAVLGLAAIGYAVFSYTPDTAFPGLAALAPCVGTALLIYTGLNTTHAPTGARLTWVARLLSWRPLVVVGLLSYSLYLWHWPILVFARHYFVRALTTNEALVLVGVSLLMAFLSWRFVERPFRRRRHEARATHQGSATVPPGAASRRLFQFTGATMLALITLGLVFDESEGLPARLSENTAKIANVAADRPPERKRCEGIPSATVNVDSLCKVTKQPAEPSFLVWGDSHAAMLMPAIRQAANAKQMNGINATSNGCAPLLDVARQIPDLVAECIAYNNAVLDVIRSNPNIQQVMLISRWAVHAEGGPFGDEGGPFALLQSDLVRASNRAENQRLFQQSLIYTLNELRSMGREVVVLGPTPAMGRNIPNDLAKATHRGRTVALDLPFNEFKERQSFVLPTLSSWAAQAGAKFVPLHPIFCDELACRAIEDGLPLFSDDDHLASTGAAKTVPLFTQLLNPTQGG